MKTISLSAKRIATLVGIALWSAHYHGGQWSRSYRIGCRARNLIESSNEIGRHLFSRWFDMLEPYVSDDELDAPAGMTKEFAEQARLAYCGMVHRFNTEKTR